MNACFTVVFLILLKVSPHTVYSLSSSSTASSVNNGIPSKFTSISNRQIGILDGAELTALNTFMKERHEEKITTSRNIGVITLVTGKTVVDGENQRTIGMEIPKESAQDESTFLTLATIPDSISDMDAISTAMASLVSVHCCAPTVNEVGGSGSGNEFVSGKAVVLGGGEFACFAARAMGELGVEVTLVTTGKPRVESKKVSIMPPMVGENELGFSDVLGKFDSMLDTLYDENGIDDDYLNTVSGVVNKLKQNHECKRYISSCNTSQKIIRESGVLFGPNEVKFYEKKIAAIASSNSELQVSIPPNFGPMTLQKLFDGNIIYPSTKKRSEICYRGWSLKDFWEYTTWPRDSEGSVNSRFGLPVVGDIESIFDDIDEVEDVMTKASIEPRREPSNPFVMDVRGVEGLQNDVVSSKTSCILFLSASYCRTCKVLTPQYTRMARLSKEKDVIKEKGIIFAKAETGSKIGKALGKSLGINAVPAFVLFRDGVRYGTPLSVSKIPSKKLEMALDYLASGAEWDNKKFASMK